MAKEPRFKEMYNFLEVTLLIKPLNGWNTLVTWFEIIEAHQPKTLQKHTWDQTKLVLFHSL